MHVLWRVLFLLCALIPALAAAETYPARPVRIVVPTGPGGAPDLIARLLAERLGPVLGQSFLVENRPGAGGTVAHAHVAKSAPDGHTLLFGVDTTIAIAPHVYPSSADVLREFVPAASLASHFFLLVVHPSLPAASLRAFIEHAKSARPPIAFGTGTSSSQQALAMLRLQRAAGTEFLAVPFKAGALITSATVAGQVMASFASGASADAWIKAGKLRVLAVTAARRSEAYPGVPAISEQYPGFEVVAWFGLFALAGTPQAALARLREETYRILALPEVRQLLWNAGALEPLALPIEDFASLVRRDVERYGQLIRELGIGAAR